MSFLKRNRDRGTQAAEPEAVEATKTRADAESGPAMSGEGSTSVRAMQQPGLANEQPTTGVDRVKSDAERGPLTGRDTTARAGSEGPRTQATPSDERRTSAFADTGDAARGSAGATAAAAAPQRDERPEHTAVLSDDELRDHKRIASEPDTARQPRIEEEENAGLAMAAPEAAERDRAAEREARQRALGVRSRSDEPASFAAPVVTKRTTDKWHGSLALTLLRLVTAAIMGVRGYQHIRNIAATEAYFQNSILPKPMYFAWGVGIAECLVALLLFIGLANRLAGLLMVIVEVGMLAFFIWGKVNPFSNGRIGFNGELELLLAAVGLVFLLLGSGGWGLDALYRRNNAKKKEERAMGNYA